MLEFIIPLYEQSRFEEQKNIPVLQIIDKGIPAEKKSYPPRSLFALLITIFMMVAFLGILTGNDIFKNSTNPKLILLKKNLTFWGSKK
jgi:hypothetical protein